MHLIAEINLAADNSTRFKILSSNRKHWCLTVCSYILWLTSMVPSTPIGSTFTVPSVCPMDRRLWVPLSLLWVVFGRVGCCGQRQRRRLKETLLHQHRRRRAIERRLFSSIIISSTVLERQWQQHQQPEGMEGVREGKKEAGREAGT